MWLGSGESCKIRSGRLTTLSSYLTGKVKCKEIIDLASMTKVRYLAGMDVSEMARLGGTARAAELSAKRRREIAVKASKAAVAARKRAKKAKAAK